VARDLVLGPGDRIMSDQVSMFDISRTYPLEMEVSGVLAPTGSPDDRAAFCDLKTAWIIDGISHGHQDVTGGDVDSNLILERTEEEVKTNAAIFEFNRVTAENIASFHTHADRSALPVSAAIVVPADSKSSTLLKARYSMSPTRRLLAAESTVDDLMALVFRVKRFFDASFALVAVSAGIFVVLVFLMSRQLRDREMRSMHRIGCSRWTTLQLQLAEFSIVIALSALAAATCAFGGAWAAQRLVGI
jgi:putative ABC transport system permease protein